MFDTALAIYKKDGDRSQTIAFDRETVEFKRLNDKVQERRDEQASIDEARIRERKRQRDYEWFCTMSFGYLVVRALILVVVGILSCDGVSPDWLTCIIGGYAIGSALIRVGRWIERRHHR